MSVYYNENNPFAAQWLRNLIAEGVIADGFVDERDIRDVAASDLTGYVQHHFFAGIGGWPYALRLAGWPDDRPVVTGSCPCQPFSTAGKRKGRDDERHLWPALRWLIAQLRPSTCFGEQVASADGREWLAGIRADLEGIGYVVGSADLCAAGVGSPHRRQRLFWVADDECTRLERTNRIHGAGVSAKSGTDSMGNTDITRSQGRSVRHLESREGCEQSAGSGSPWSDYEIVWCDERDSEKGIVARRVEPGSFPLVNGTAFRLADGRTREDTSRAELLKGIGNAIVPQVAAEFIRVSMEPTP